MLGHTPEVNQQHYLDDPDFTQISELLSDLRTPDEKPPAPPEEDSDAPDEEEGAS